jgi:hypothetical protein
MRIALAEHLPHVSSSGAGVAVRVVIVGREQESGR